MASTPIELATALVRASTDTEYVIYERGGEWLVALGRLATVRASASQVTLVQNSETRHWDGPDIAANVARALGAMSVDGWRAYGSTMFELADHFHGAGAATGETLLELVVPRLEVRLRAGDVVLRGTESSELEKLVRQISELDRVQSRGVDERPAVRTLDMAATIAEHDADRYRQNVSRAVEDIRIGRYEKVILSRRVPVPQPVDMLQTYLHGRRHNTPARSFLVNRPSLQMLGFSPETVVEVSAKGEVSTQPLAGTRALGRTPEEQYRLRRQLETDVKEIAEHAVSVRLAVEELKPICAVDSVRVTEFMGVSERGSVQHLASRVRGRLMDGASAWQAFEALFPAVTASGIPKRQAIEAIHQYEGRARGPYSGSVLMVDSDGEMDAALVLRSLFRQGDDTWLQAGAGIVAQSTPERELEETREKLSSLSGFLVAETEVPVEAKKHRAVVGGGVQ
ncbi:salicylate synthase [Pseudomonas matsuisoli]|uniref:salicylate synthase n=1 Tax=Pseudomonas matsuisoli TaxID=1515666 RepID=UPI00227B27FE